MQINSSTLSALRTTFSMAFQQGVKNEPDVFWQKLATKIPVNNKTVTMGWLADTLNLREWVGARVEQNLREHAATYAVKPYEGTVGVDRDDIEDDNLGVYTSITMPSFGRAVAKHPDKLILDLLREASSTGPLMWDGKRLFADDHPTYDVTETTTTYDNKLALALTEDNYYTARIAMQSYVGESGDILGINPNLLIVPPQLEKMAKNIVKNATSVQKVYNAAGTEIVAAGVIDNVFAGTADVLVIKELGNDPTRWYLADISRPVKPFMDLMRKEAQFVAKDSPTDDNVFHQRKFLYGVDGRWSVGATLPFLILTSKPA